jgi:signal peptidase I
MEQASNRGTNPRWPCIALLLSVLAPGLGHIYCGKPAKGLVLFFLGFVFFPIIVFCPQNVSSAFILAAILASIILLIAVFFYAVVDAWFLAKRIDEHYEVKKYNQWYLYVLVIIISLSYPPVMSYSIRQSLIQAYVTAAGSMLPNLLVKDYVILNKTAYRHRLPEIGDVIAFKPPNDRNLIYVKRIVALPGDTIEVKDNILYINDMPLQYRKAAPLPYVKVSPDSSSVIESGIAGEIVEEIRSNKSYRIQLFKSSGANSSADFAKTIVPDMYCFVLGDNRDNSLDSRHFGPVPLADILGKVDFIYLPAGSWSRFGRFPQ